MEKEALIVFIKNPIKGRVKTRLAATIGRDAAYKVYEKLLSATLNVSTAVNCTKYVFYSDFVPTYDSWQNNGFIPCLQRGYNLGERMLNAFLFVFSKQFEKVSIIGSDCFDLTAEHITRAFEALDQHDVVLGPAKDGGYYLLGMKNLYPLLFLEKPWSSELLLIETLQDIKEHHLTSFELPILTDIDTEEDLPLDLKLDVSKTSEEADSLI